MPYRIDVEVDGRDIVIEGALRASVDEDGDLVVIEHDEEPCIYYRGTWDGLLVVVEP